MPYYITTAIPYATSVPHIGNSSDAIITDAIARYHRMKGEEVFFLTGMDEHGQKIQHKAEAEGITPKELVDRVSGEARRIWDRLNVSYDHFIRTTDKDHIKAVQGIFRRLYEKGDIYLDKYTGWYCSADEAFYTDSQITQEHACPDCGLKVVRAEEEAYFFRLSKYAEALAAHIETHPEFIQPESRKNEMLNNFIKPGLQDLCVSRTSFNWGVPVPFNERHVAYVWIDALSNYITGLGYNPEGESGELYKKFWPADVHVIGKDVVRFHTIYWPCFLLALGEPLPKQIYGHGWFLFGEDKMSKSKGNVLQPDDLIDKYGTDAVRYYVVREMPFSGDANITHSAMKTRINSDLVNDLGNLLSRSVTMVEKYFQGDLPEFSDSREAVDQELSDMALETAKKYEEYMDGLQSGNACAQVLRLISRANKYIDETSPWTLAKDETKKERLAAVLYNLCEVLRLSAIWLTPIMPESCGKILNQLGLDPDGEHTDFAKSCIFGKKIAYSVHKGEILFPRIADEEK